MAPVIKGTLKQSIKDLLSLPLPDIEIKMAPNIEFITNPQSFSGFRSVSRITAYFDII